MVWLEQTRIVGPDVQIGVDDREFRALFQKQQVCNAIICFMIADRNHIRRQHIHNFNGGYAAKLGINDRTAEHISGNAVDRISLLTACPVDITGQSGNAADQSIIQIFSQKISVKIVGMKYRQFFIVVCHSASPFIDFDSFSRSASRCRNTFTSRLFMICS